MITAQEARNISNKAYKEQIDAELVSIVPEIEAAMRKGEYCCWIYETNISFDSFCEHVRASDAFCHSIVMSVFADSIRDVEKNVNDYFRIIFS